MGYFIGARPPTYLALKRKVLELWKVKGNLDIHSMPSGFILFRFENEEDKISVLERGLGLFLEKF